MCTVTFTPVENGFVFASNRDEQAQRKTSPPDYYQELGVRLFYPKDEVAGGTWIGLSEHNRLVCLLNGGHVYHDPTIKFPKSRGQVVKEILVAQDLITTLTEVDLTGFAPFTLVVVDWKKDNKVYEMVWCKSTKYLQELKSDHSYIWSSSTLYTEEMKCERKDWFDKEVLSKSGFVQDRILAFHQNENLGNMGTAPKMKRNLVETVSTTLVVKEGVTLSKKYFDYVNDLYFDCENIFGSVKI
ncbi:NRDE family protein [Wenyingzhuangia sp. 1_MG-2023]|nr:NRDE family protein [Wenyingzhuangia sp. 1_MG-2023]